MPRYQVVVGNIGTVIDTDNYREAMVAYSDGIEMSQGAGRAAGESVTLFDNGEIFMEYMGAIDLGEDDFTRGEHDL